MSGPEQSRLDLDAALADVPPAPPAAGSAEPATAWIVALAGLPGMGPARLAALLDVWPASEAWARVLGGGLHRDARIAGRVRGLREEVVAGWAVAARAVDVASVGEQHRDAGVAVVVPGDPRWPARLRDDPEPPAVLFVRGEVRALAPPAVAIVGTRRATPTGRSVARELGRDLAAEGVCVLSGLALGIDGAAHAGALEATGGVAPVAVVGTGLDRTYPRAHAALCDLVAGAGAVVSEYPLGTPPAAWRFPARNRILAGLCDVLVVVESGRTGGSMHTVDAAIERDRTVLAVPGSVRNPMAAGTNGLLAAGCGPARDVTDVLVALGLGASGGRGGRDGDEPVVTADQALVLDALGWDAASLEQVADRLGEPLGPVALHLGALERLGVVTRNGAWYARILTGRR